MIVVIDADYVRIRLEGAGRTMMMLPNSGVWPMRYVSTWPEALKEWEDMIGCNLDPAPAKIRPTMQQMNELAEVADWLVLLAKYCQARSIRHVAKTVGFGMLRWPDSDRQRYPWTQLAKLVRCNDKTAKKWYEDGIDILVRILNDQKLAADLKARKIDLGIMK